MLSVLRQASQRSLTATRSLSTTTARLNEVAKYPDPGPNPHVVAPAFPARPTGLNLPPAPTPGRPPIMDIPPAEDPLLHFISSMLMRDGKRRQSDRQTAHMLLHVHALTRREPLEVVREAVRAASPFVRSRKVKTGAKTFYIPMPLSEKQRTHYGVKWMLEACKNRPDRTVEERLAREMIAVLTAKEPKENSVLKKKQDQHEFVMLNRYVFTSQSETRY